jgi:hypothetical protein
MISFSTSPVTVAIANTLPIDASANASAGASPRASAGTTGSGGFAALFTSKLPPSAQTGATNNTQTVTSESSVQAPANGDASTASPNTEETNPKISDLKNPQKKSQPSASNASQYGITIPGPTIQGPLTEVLAPFDAVAWSVASGANQPGNVSSFPAESTAISANTGIAPQTGGSHGSTIPEVIPAPNGGYGAFGISPSSQSLFSRSLSSSFELPAESLRSSSLAEPAPQSAIVPDSPSQVAQDSASATTMDNAGVASSNNLAASFIPAETPSASSTMPIAPALTTSVSSTGPAQAGMPQDAQDVALTSNGSATPSSVPGSALGSVTATEHVDGLTDINSIDLSSMAGTESAANDGSDEEPLMISSGASVPLHAGRDKAELVATDTGEHAGPISHASNQRLNPPTFLNMRLSAADTEHLSTVAPTTLLQDRTLGQNVSNPNSLSSAPAASLNPSGPNFASSNQIVSYQAVSNQAVSAPSSAQDSVASGGSVASFNSNNGTSQVPSASKESQSSKPETSEPSSPKNPSVYASPADMLPDTVSANGPSLAPNTAPVSANVAAPPNAADLPVSDSDRQAGAANAAPHSLPAFEPQPASPSSPVQMAQMVAKAAQSEMRIGLSTSAFGSVEVRAVVHASDVGVLIGSEKGDLRSLLANELPGIANTLQQQNLRLNQVNFQHGFSFSNQTSSDGGSQSRWYPAKANNANSASAEGTGNEAGDLSEETGSGFRAGSYAGLGAGLSILA